MTASAATDDGKLPILGLIAGMVVLGIGVGLFYSSITTAAVTALEASRASLAGGIVYMFQVAGGAIGLGVNTAIVVANPSLSAGIRTAFVVDAILAAIGFVVALLFIGGKVDKAVIAAVRRHRHRAHA